MPTSHDDLLDTLYDIAGAKPPKLILFACPCGYSLIAQPEVSIQMHIGAKAGKAERELVERTWRTAVAKEHEKECSGRKA
jgi:hypothetical protein